MGNQKKHNQVTITLLAVCFLARFPLQRPSNRGYDPWVVTQGGGGGGAGGVDTRKQSSENPLTPIPQDRATTLLHPNKHITPQKQAEARHGYLHEPSSTQSFNFNTPTTSSISKPEPLCIVESLIQLTAILGSQKPDQGQSHKASPATQTTGKTASTNNLLPLFQPITRREPKPSKPILYTADFMTTS